MIVCHLSFLREEIKTEIAVKIGAKIRDTPPRFEVFFVTNNIIAPPKIIPVKNIKMTLYKVKFH